MLVQINNNNDNHSKEWCLLEFQGDIIGDLVGNNLGDIEIKDVFTITYLVYKYSILILGG